MSAGVDLQQVLALAMAGPGEPPALSARQRQVCMHVRECRTAALGGLRQHCGQCGYERVRYHSCRDRHCPKCQGRVSAKWAERQSAQVLPVTYHHLVFTVPSALNGWVALHPNAIYGQLFASAWATLSAFCAKTRRLGGQGAMTAVLHTWGQTLTRHVHLHCLVPGGVLSKGQQWRPAPGTTLFAVRALSRRFRGHFVAGLRARANAGELQRLSPGEVDAMLDALMAREWVVYAKPCLGHTERVVDYLARYSHRVALADSRLLAIDGERVALRYRDYREKSVRKTLWLDAGELIRRFLLHVLPKGLMRIRHYGFLANCCRARRLRTIRAAIEVAAQEEEKSESSSAATPIPEECCPRCRTGALQVIANIAPRRLEGGWRQPTTI